MNARHHTNAVNMAAGDVKKVIDSFKDEPGFMAKSDRSEKRAADRAEAIASAPAEIQGLRGFLSDAVIERLARLDKED